MTSITHHNDSHEPSNGTGASLVERKWALGALAITALLVILSFATASGPLALPLLAAKLTVLAVGAGLAVWISGREGRSRWLPAAGVFALAAIAASIIGEHDAVVGLFN